ncbi:hypothetical protein [Paracoccus marcusii]|uniref:hypothetical protein n=1 Tax=Paracoccus marcusii TaxID=59779 RepID=UPI00326584C7
MRNLLGVALLVMATTASAQESLIEPSFGFTWDDKLSEIRQKYPDVTVETEGRYTVARISGDSYSNLPGNTDFVQLTFSQDSSLIKVRWTSDNFTDDRYGTEGKAVFEDVYETLQAKMGPGKLYQYSGIELYEDSDEFYECLEYEGCGAWVAFWDNVENTDSGSMLQLKGLSRGTGYLAYSVEHPKLYEERDRVVSEDLSKF